MIMKSFLTRSHLGYVLLFLLMSLSALCFAGIDNDLPPRPNPPRLVNDMAGMMTPTQQEELEALLVNFDQTTSSQITIVTIKNLGDHDVAEFAIELFNKWGIGQKGKNNGVLIFAASESRKMWITTGLGMEGALTDALTGRIVRNEMVPQFKAGNYFLGFKNAATAIIAATKGEYTREDAPGEGKGSGIPALAVILIVIVIIIIIALGGGGKGGGNYMSRRGSDFMTGAILGSLLGGGGGGWRSGGSGGGGWSGGGGFGGFGGGSTGGGGAGGSW